MAKKRRLRKVGFALGGVVVLLVLLLAFAPAILNMGLARSFAVGAIEKSVDGAVDIDRVRLGWSGPQELRGLTIVDGEGREALAVDASVEQGLLALLRAGAIDVTVSGRAHGALHEDGTTSFAKLIKTGDEPDRKKKDERPASPEPAGEMPALSVNVTGFDITLDVEGDGGAGPIRLPALTGTGKLVPGGTTTLVLKSPVESGDRTGALDVDVTAAGLLDARGRVTPRGATLRATATLSNVDVPFAEQVEVLDRLALEAQSDDLTEAIALGIAGETTVEGGVGCRLTGSVTALQPMAADGRVTLRLARMTADLEGHDVPTALVQPFVAMELAGGAVTLTDLLGPKLDVAAQVSEGAEKQVAVTLTAERLSSELSARVDQRGAVRNGRGSIVATFAPDVVAALAGLAIDAPATARLDLEQLELPAGDDAGPDLAGLALAGRVTLTEPLKLKEGGAAETIELRDVELRVNAAPLKDGMRATGGAKLGEGRVALDLELNDLIGADGALAAANARSDGAVTLENIDSVRLIKVFAPDTDERVQRLLRGPVEGKITSATGDEGMALGADVRSAHFDLAVRALRADDAVEVSRMQLGFEASPSLVKSLQGDTETPVRLTQPTRAVLALEPFVLTADDEGNPATREPVRGKLTVGEAIVRHDTLVSPLRIADLAVTMVADLAAPTYRVDGGATLARADGTVPIGKVTCSLETRRVDDELRPDGTLTLAAENLTELEQLLGIEPEAVSGVVGGTGELRIELAAEAGARTASVVSELPFLNGRMNATLGDDDVLGVTIDGIEFVAQRAMVQAVLASSDDADAMRTVEVADDLPMKVKGRAALPLAALRGEPFASALAQIDTTFTAGRVRLRDKDGMVSSIKNVTLKTRTDDIARGVDFEMNGAIGGRGVEQDGSLRATGTVNRLLDDAGRLDVKGKTITIDAKLERAPTALADAMYGLDGLLSAVLGSEISGAFTSRNFSSASGRADLKLTTPFGSLDAPVLGKKNALIVQGEDRPLVATLDLTDGLRNRLLRELHPLLGDVRATEDRIKLEVPSRSLFPLDGEIERMRADVRLTIGKVEFDPGSDLLGFLRLFGKGQTQAVPGRIDPIDVTIRRGIVQYKPFNIYIEDQRIETGGTVNLVNRTADLTYDVPLGLLGAIVDPIKPYVSASRLKLNSRGQLGALKTEIDPATIAEATLRGFGTGLIGEVPEETAPLKPKKRRKKKKKDSGG